MQNAPSNGGRLASYARSRRTLVTEALAVLDTWGFREVEVPLLAPFEELRGAIGAERAEQLFRFVDRDGKLVVLRGDLTPVVARQFSLWMSNHALPARLAYANRVARLERAFAREEVESYELGMELVGAPGIAGDMETLTIVFDLLDALHIPSVEVRIGDVRLLGGLLAEPQIPEGARAGIERAVRLRDPWEVSEVCRRHSVEVRIREALMMLCEHRAGRAELARLGTCGVESVAAAVGELQERIVELDVLGLSERVELDLSARDDRGYYTGMRFRIVCEELGAEIGSGGRYDRLYGYFGPSQAAVGFGLRVDRLVALHGRRREGESPAARRIQTGEGVGASLKSAREARRRGERVVVDWSGGAR